MCGGCPYLATDLSYISPQDLREKNWKAMEALASAERACEEKLRSLIQAKVRVPRAWSDLLVWQTTWNAQTLRRAALALEPLKSTPRAPRATDGVPRGSCAFLLALLLFPSFASSFLLKVKGEM